MTFKRGRTAVVVVWLTLLASIGHAQPPPSGDAVAKANQILRDLWKQKQVRPTTLCTDGEFLRRVTLDLWGRIPTPQELQRFLDEPDRDATVAKMLERDEFAEFWAAVTTTQWCGYRRENNSDREVLRYWLIQALKDRMPYDEIAQRVIAAEGASATYGPVNFLLRHWDQPAVKISRVFLGVRLDCAQCHDHPFDRWTQDDYREMERFFAATRRSEISEGNLRLSSTAPPKADNPPRFLTGAKPRSARWRDEFALFTTRSKPFARNFGNRLWYHFLGRGIVHPIDDYHRDNPPVSRELFEHLADVARQTRFDIRAMCRLICATDAYQLSSAGIYPSSDPQSAAAHRVFAVRTIKPLSLEQHLGAMETAVGVSLTTERRREFFRASVGETLDEDFSRLWEHRESQQTLMMRLARNAPPLTGSIDELYLRFLSRLPSARERRIAQGHSLREIVFALLHSHEFCLNH